MRLPRRGGLAPTCAVAPPCVASAAVECRTIRLMAVVAPTAVVSQPALQKVLDLCCCRGETLGVQQWQAQQHAH